MVVWLRMILKLEKAINQLTRIINSVAIVALAGMMFLTFTDVMLRYIFNRPITGAFEITEFMMAILISFTLAYTQTQKGHVAIDVFVYRLSDKTQAIIDCIVYFLSLSIIFIIFWQTLVKAQSMKLSGEISGVMPVPIYLFVYVFAFGSAILLLVIIADFFKSLSKVVKK